MGNDDLPVMVTPQDVVGVVDRHNGYGRAPAGQRKHSNPTSGSVPVSQNYGQQQYYQQPQQQTQQYQPSRVQPQQQQHLGGRFETYSRHNQSQPLLYLTHLNQQLYNPPPPQQQQQQQQQQYQQYPPLHQNPPSQQYQHLNPPSQQHYQPPQQLQYAPAPQQAQHQQHQYGHPPQQSQQLYPPTPLQQHQPQYSNYQQRPQPPLAPSSYEQYQPLHAGRASVDSIPTRVSPPHKRPSNGDQTLVDLMERVSINDPSKAQKAAAAQKRAVKQQKLESELRSTFDRVDTNRTGRISPSELARALSNFDRTPFKESTVILMIKLFGSTNPQSGALRGLNFEQFVELWKHLLMYKKLFLQADSDRLGDISFGEFHEIVKEIGYKLDVDLVLFVFQKFCPKDQNDIGRLKFDVFIELLVYLRKVTDVFKKYDDGMTGVATIPFADFLLEVTNL